MSKFYVANFFQYHIHRTESTEEDYTSLAAPVLTLNLQDKVTQSHVCYAH